MVFWYRDSLGAGWSFKPEFHLTMTVTCTIAKSPTARSCQPTNSRRVLALVVAESFKILRHCQILYTSLILIIFKILRGKSSSLSPPRGDYPLQRLASNDIWSVREHHFQMFADAPMQLCSNIINHHVFQSCLP